MGLTSADPSESAEFESPSVAGPRLTEGQGALQASTPTTPVAGPVVEISGIALSFGGTQVLEDVNISVMPGEIVGVIGPNGAGKSTLFNVISGFLSADHGEVKINGKLTRRMSPHKIARLGVGRTFQTARPFDKLTVLENAMVPALIAMRTRREAETAARSALQRVLLTDAADKPVSALSTGELRRLELARAMAGGAQILLLDEFLGGLMGADGAVLLEALNVWRQEGGTILAIEHTMRAMDGFVDRFVVLNFGRIIADGTSAEILTDPEVIGAYLGSKWVKHA